MVSRTKFIAEGQAVNLTTDQLNFMWMYLAKVHHSHSIEEVEGLSEALVEAGVEPDEEDDEDEIAAEFGEDEEES